MVLSRGVPKGIAGLLATKSVERYSVPSIVLVLSTISGQVVGSGRSEALRPLSELLLRFGGHAQAVGLTMAVGHIEEFRENFPRSIEPVGRGDNHRPDAKAKLTLSFVGRHFYEQLLLLVPLRSP